MPLHLSFLQMLTYGFACTCGVLHAIKYACDPLSNTEKGVSTLTFSLPVAIMWLHMDRLMQADSKYLDAVTPKALFSLTKSSCSAFTVVFDPIPSQSPFGLF